MLPTNAPFPFTSGYLTLSVLTPTLENSSFVVGLFLLASPLAPTLVYRVSTVRLSLLPSTLAPASTLVVYSVAAVRLSLLPSALSLLPLWWSTAFRLLDSHSLLPIPPRFRSLLDSALVVYSVSAVRLSLLASAQVLSPRFRSGGLQHFGCQTLSASVISTFGLQRTIGTRSMERIGGCQQQRHDTGNFVRIDRNRVGRQDTQQ